MGDILLLVCLLNQIRVWIFDCHILKLENGRLKEVNFMNAARVYLGYKDRYDENANAKKIAVYKECAKKAGDFLQV